MPVTEEIKAAVIAAHGTETVGALVERYGLSRGQILGIWHRRPRDTPEEAARVAARAAEAAAAPEPRPFTPEDPGFSGQKAAAWSALMAGGHAGATADEILVALYPDGDRPASWRTIYPATLRGIRRLAGRHGFGVALVPEAKPTRWRIVREDGTPYFGVSPELAPAPPEAATVPESRPEVATPVPLGPVLAPAPDDASGVYAHLTGAPGAVHRLTHRCCRWPIRETGSEGFRFCGAVAIEGKPYCAEHRRVAMGDARQSGRAA